MARVMPQSQIQFCRRPIIGRRKFSLIGQAFSRWAHGHPRQRAMIERQDNIICDSGMHKLECLEMPLD